MRVSREEMNRSHERIVEGAARLFRERGVDNSSVADVMEAAGLTHGGFYRHFEAKDGLVSAAIKSAFRQVKEMISANMRDNDPDVAIARYRSYYLSEGHLSQPGSACPVATLASEIARASPGLKAEFGNGVRQILEVLSHCYAGKGKKQRQAEATREFALLVGAAVIARACDSDTAKAVLAACR
jgi:TetR/AcrR family transcriptional repressor of nem operon